MGNKFEKIELEKAEKEYSSDRCLEQAITYINDFKKFYESAFVKDTATEYYGFSEEEQGKMLKLAKELKENILDEYQKNEKLLVPKNSHFNHLAGNSIMIFAGGHAMRYDNKKTVSPESKKMIRNQMNLLNYYVQELVKNKKLIKDEITHKNGYLQKFSKYFNGGVMTESQKRIIIFKFFNEWKQGNIKQENLEEELGKLDDKFINKEKIRNDFAIGRALETD